MKPLLLSLAAVALVGLNSSALIVDACGQETRPAAKAAPPSTVSFAEDVFPIFKGRCVDRHHPGGQGYEASGLDLTTYVGE